MRSTVLGWLRGLLTCRARKRAVVTALDRTRLQHSFSDLLGQEPREEDRARIIEAEQELLRARLIKDQAQVSPDLVTMRSTVLLRDLDSGLTRECSLVYPADEVHERAISVLSPLGLALLGAHAGELVAYEEERVPRRVWLEAVVYQPESAGHFHL
jgi:regulator of nucleoside diphosphate kinase